MTDDPVELDNHRGMAAQKATTIRRALAEVENKKKALREGEQLIETHILAIPADSWHGAAGKARYLLNLYLTSLPPHDSQHRDLVASMLGDFSRLEGGDK